MDKTKDTQIPNVMLTDIERLTQRIRKDLETEDVEVGFEFIIASLFPTSWKNIQNALSTQYKEGYIQGYKDGENDMRHSFRFNDDDVDCYCE